MHSQLNPLSDFLFALFMGHQFETSEPPVAAVGSSNSFLFFFALSNVTHRLFQLTHSF